MNKSCKLTGIPQFVLIPAPVTTMTFFDFPSTSAISCSSRAEPGETLMVGIVPSATKPFSLADLFCRSKLGSCY